MSNTSKISKEDWERLAQDLQNMPGQHYSEEIASPLIENQPQSIEEFIKIEYIDEYHEKMRFFWSELVELNIILYLAEKIIEFPLKLFRPNHHDGHIFLGTVMDSFYQSAILLISRLATDEGSDCYTLFRFKNIMWNDWLTEKGKNRLRANLSTKAVKEGYIKDLAIKKVKELRRLRYAHTLIESFDPNIEVYHPGLNDLKEICALLNSFFDTLTPHTNYGKLPVHYFVDASDTSWVQQEDHKTDIEEILDGIAQRSSLLNLPETSKGMWELQKPHLSEKEIEKFNYYRRKFNLPEV
jgi:hypothetical protein